MKRIKLVVAYDGTNYCGWQIQPNDITVEKVLNDTLTKLLGVETKIIGASRTDSGVHALGNVAVFDTDSTIPGERFAYAVNCLLPDDIAIQESSEVAPDFHPRHCETRKTYEYKVLNRKFPMPTKRMDTYFYPYNLDVEAMKEAGQYLVGEHDFKSFCSVKTQTETTVRTIYAIEVKHVDDVIIIQVKGNGFLYNMVRIIAGTLMQVGSNKMAPEKVKEMLNSCDRTVAGPTAPPQGLTLVEIEYLSSENANSDAN